MSDTQPTETTAPSLASRVGDFFDAQVTEAAPTTEAPAPAVAETETPVVATDATEAAPGSTETPASDDGEATDVDLALDPDFEASLAKHGVPTSLEEVPEEARPLVEKKLKDLERGFTKAMQEARSYRQEKAAFDLEQRYAREKPASFFADKLLADPKLIEAVNEEIEKRNVPAYAEAVAKERAAEQRLAEVQSKETQRDAEQRESALAARAEHVETYTAQQAKAAGIPFALVEEAVALAVSANPDLSDADVARIVSEKARVYKQHLAANRGAAKRELAKEKASDAKHAGLTAVPAAPARSTASRQSATPNATNEQKPQTLREKLNATLDERLQAA